jgi:metal iron transporter
MIGLVPSVTVAIAVGRPGINTLLVASQVALSVILPFVAFPLIFLTSSKSIMSVRRPRQTENGAGVTTQMSTASMDTSPSILAAHDEATSVSENVLTRCWCL